MRGAAAGALVAAVLVALAGCDTAEQAQRRTATTPDEPSRVACVSRELVAHAEDNRLSLDELAAGDTTGADPAQALSQRAARSAFEFARAYEHLATVRATRAAFMDSSLNHAATPADSSRYSALAAQSRLQPPGPGTVEANVTDAYMRDFAVLLNDSDHPCNWRVDP